MIQSLQLTTRAQSSDSKAATERSASSVAHRLDFSVCSATVELDTSGCCLGCQLLSERQKRSSERRKMKDQSNLNMKYKRQPVTVSCDSFSLCLSLVDLTTLRIKL